MSASPLPAIPVASPAPAPSPAPARSHSSDSAFGTHLQNAQQQQSASSDDAQGAASQNANQGNNQQGAGNAQANASSSSGTDVTQNSGANGDSGSFSIPTNAGELVSTVLGLIDKAVSDSGNSNGKASDNKPSTQVNTAHAAQPTNGMAPLIAPVVPIASSGKVGDSTSGVSTLQANGNGAGNNLATDLQKSSDLKSADSADGGSSSAVSSTSDSSASTAGASDPTQTFAGTLSAAGHAAAMTAGALPSTNVAAGSTPDLSALSGVANAAAVAAPAGTNTAGHALSVNAPVGSSGFAKELGQQVTWLSGQDIKQAQIRLNPQDLGPLDVKVSVEHGRVDVAFMTQHPATANAVQQGLGQLNQMLGGQGLSLGHTSVGQHAGQQFAGQQQQSSGGQASTDTDNTADSSTAETLTRVAVGLVDAFA
jgi:flagellar hook-length control protein FliK